VNQSTAQSPVGFVERLIRDPNAIWMREMRQSARIGRTPWVLFAITLGVSLLMCSIGGLSSAGDTAPASIGSALFQVFFSIAYLVVVVLGPAVAANSIASEREGRTWEAVILTGLAPKEIARGKFLAAYTTVALYIVVLAPVGALSFLFGGVTATEVVAAFAFLFVLAALGVAFGLAMSSLMASLRGAIVVTLILAVLIGPTLYLFYGVGCSFWIHRVWPAVPEALPVWLPLAYSRAPLGVDYAVLLLFLPLVLMLVPAWFLYEVTVSNMTGESEDRSLGLKRWFAVCAPVYALACVALCATAADDDTRGVLAQTGVQSYAAFATFSALLFAFDPVGPSHRVRVHWARNRTGALRRFFGPGLTKTMVLVTLFGFAGILAVAGADIFLQQTYGKTGTKEVLVSQTFFVALYYAPFFVFEAGLVAWLRSRGNTPWVTRLIAIAILALINAGPWIVAAIGGVMASGSGEDWIIIGAPSPAYVFYMAQWIRRGSPTGSPVIEAGIACALVWGFVGTVLLSFASRRCRRVVRAYDEAIAQTEAALDAEAAGAAPGPPAVAAAPVPASPG
jgi:ABC-type transport system involved in multi-copper enzyme maturation permease subunit